MVFGTNHLDVRYVVSEAQGSVRIQRSVWSKGNLISDFVNYNRGHLSFRNTHIPLKSLNPSTRGQKCIHNSVECRLYMKGRNSRTDLVAISNLRSILAFSFSWIILTLNISSPRKKENHVKWPIKIKIHRVRCSAHRNQFNRYHQSHWKLEGGIQIRIKMATNKIEE